MILNKNININLSLNNKIKVYAFVGPSGTGKSYRAQMVAGEYDIHYIIDDGLLIKDNEVIGNGSNLIFVNDYDGVIIKLDKLNNVQINDNEVVVGAGISLIGLALKVSRIGLKGMEFATGIPGTIGGAVYMNAGAYKEDMASIIKKVKLLDENDNIVFDYKIKKGKATTTNAQFLMKMVGLEI